MAMTQPDFIPGIFAADGQFADIPATGADSGRVAWNIGFPQETSQPLSAGGIPPRRLDMNGVDNIFSQHIFFQQSGGLYAWDAGLEYPAGAHVLGSNGVEYVAQIANGPSENIGAVNPVTDTLFRAWKPLTRMMVDLIYPVGSIYLSANAVNPGTLFGGTWSRITGRFLLAANDTSYVLGSSGGSSTKSLSVSEMPSHSHGISIDNAGQHNHTANTASNGAHTHTITVQSNGAHTHTLAAANVSTSSAGAHTHSGLALENGAHTHRVTYAQTTISNGNAASVAGHTHSVTFPKTTISNGSAASAGAHTHTRGTMEITGRVPTGARFFTDHSSWTQGAFSLWQRGEQDGDTSGDSGGIFNFKASNAWTGATSSNGAHTHTVTVVVPKTEMTSGSSGVHGHVVTVTVPEQNMTTASSGAHTHTVSTQSAGAHTHTVSGTTASSGAHTHTASSASAGAHTHTVIVANNGTHMHEATITSTGGGAAFSIMPPYLAVNVWKRTA